MAITVLAALLGASIGSFLNVVADRLPAGGSLVRPRSHCPACGRTLTSLELVPVVSYLALRGRCYGCRSSIPRRVLAVEVILGALATYLWLRYDASWAVPVLFAFCALLVLIAAIDLDQGLILNVLVYPGLALALALAPWWRHLGLERSFLGHTSAGYVLLGSLAGAALSAGFFALIITIYPSGMGWGDVKMAALIGMLAGIPGSVVALLAGIVSGGIWAVGLLALRLRARKQTMPFGPFLALGGVMALLWGNALWKWYVSLL